MTSLLLSLYVSLVSTAAGLTAVPQPEAKMPDWAQGFTTILNWASWFALGVCVLGVIISGGAMALASRRGEGGEHATRLGLCGDRVGVGHRQRGVGRMSRASDVRACTRVGSAWHASRMRRQPPG
jgi:hypothetical protein